MNDAIWVMGFICILLAMVVIAAHMSYGNTPKAMYNSCLESRIREFTVGNGFLGNPSKPIVVEHLQQVQSACAPLLEEKAK